MKTLKYNFDELPSDEGNMLGEPEVAYTYENKKDCESILIGKFDEIASKPILEKQIIFEPDEDFYNSIPMETVRDKLHEVVDKLYAK
ncbi:MAG: hypothetical protein FWG79_08715 [Bacteroidales bacterium]|nr:hypothetical protein [Bacteroidales bacterium]